MIRLATIILCTALATAAQTTQLPPAGSSFLDAATSNIVWRLSDRTLCPGGATTEYSDVMHHSVVGDIVFECRPDAANANLRLWPVYGADKKLLFKDAGAAAKANVGGSHNLKQVQWSQRRRVLYAIQAGTCNVLELDPFGGVTKVVLTGFCGNFDFRVGPADQFVGRSNDKNTLWWWDGVKTRTLNVGALALSPDQPSVTQDGRPYYIWSNSAARTWNNDLSVAVAVADLHGHTGFFNGSNGQSYLVKRVAPQVGCNPDGKGWRPEEGIYNTVTGKREVTWGCDQPPGDGNWDRDHRARSTRARDLFGTSGHKEAALWRIDWAAGTVVKQLVALTHAGSCGYRGLPRAALHPDGTELVFTSGMADGNVLEVGGAAKACTNGERDLDVYVAVAAVQTPPPPAPTLPPPLPAMTVSVTCPMTSTASLRCSTDVSKLPKGDVTIEVFVRDAKGNVIAVGKSGTVRLY